MLLNEEKVNRNHLWLYHRTEADLSMSEIWEKGLDNSKNRRSMYGKGFYGTYVYNILGGYGDNIVRGVADISNFAIYEKDIYDQVQNHEDDTNTFEEHLQKIAGVTEVGEYSSDLALENYQKNQSDGYDGIIFHGRQDDKVVAVWTESKFVPHSYVETRKTATPKLGRSLIKDGVWNGPIVVEGNLDLRRTPITSLGKLKSVSGGLHLYDTPITSLGNLESVGGWLNLNGTSITSLGKLKSVDGGLDLNGTPITSLGNLESVGGSLNLNGTPITSLGNLESVGGWLDLKGTPITSLGNLESVDGYLDLNGTSITSLGNLESVGGDLDLNGTSITSLGNLESVGGDLGLNGTPITSLGNLESVGGWLDLKGTSITSLGNLKSVSGNLHLGDTPITSLGNLESVGGDIYTFKGTFRSIEEFNKAYGQNVQESISPFDHLCNMINEVFTLDDGNQEEIYQLFKVSYEKETGTSWSPEKFYSRAKSWEFFGEEGGFIAMRKQRSGMYKMVGVAGNPRKIYNGFKEVESLDAPVWGMMDLKMVNMITSRSKSFIKPPAFLVKLLLPRIPKSVFGNVDYEIQKDGGVIFKYSDVGDATKYFVANKKYFSNLLKSGVSELPTAAKIILKKLLG